MTVQNDDNSVDKDDIDRSISDYEKNDLTDLEIPENNEDIVIRFHACRDIVSRKGRSEEVSRMMDDARAIFDETMDLITAYARGDLEEPPAISSEVEYNIIDELVEDARERIMEEYNNSQDRHGIAYVVGSFIPTKPDTLEITQKKLDEAISKFGCHIAEVVKIGCGDTSSDKTEEYRYHQ